MVEKPFSKARLLIPFCLRAGCGLCLSSCILTVLSVCHKSRFKSESPVEEWVICRINKQNTWYYKEYATAYGWTHSTKSIDCVVSVLEEEFLDSRENRHTSNHCKDNKEAVIYKGVPSELVCKWTSVWNHAYTSYIEEELSKLSHILKVEYAEADYNNKLAINVLPP